jgi:hypothetical protein
MLVKKQRSEAEVDKVVKVVMVETKMVEMVQMRHQRLVFSFLMEQLS